MRALRRPSADGESYPHHGAGGGGLPFSLDIKLVTVVPRPQQGGTTVHTYTRHAGARLGGVLVLALGAMAPRVEAICISGPPICIAGPNDIASVRGVDGTAQANPNNIASITLQAGATNLTLTTGGTPSLATFRVVQTNPAADGQGVVVAQDSLGVTCTVPVSFRNRSAGIVSNAEICGMTSLAGEENYSLTVLSAPPLATPGTSACSSHVVTCADLPQAGYAYPTASRVLTVKSPIASAGAVKDIQMEVVKKGAFDPTLRMFFARSTDGGHAFSAYTNITSSVTSGSIPLTPVSIIRGTGQWSDVKLIIGQQILFPGVTPWGVALLALLMLLAVIRFARRRATSSA